MKDIAAISLSSDMEPPRKKRVRARLDHLSVEQKMERRKEKNRQAAQTARDRKRNKIERLEAENRELHRLLRSVYPDYDKELKQSAIDSGVSGIDAESSRAESPSTNSNQMDYLQVPDSKTNNYPSSPSTCITMNDYSASTSPAPSAEYIDSIIGDINEQKMTEDIQQLASFVIGGSSTEIDPLESAALINAPPQQVQGTTSLESTSMEKTTSTGWTEVQLMLLLLITKIHHLLSARTSCCVRRPSRVARKDSTNCVEGTQMGNLYDYILQTKCPDFLRAADSIISSKGNVRRQQLAALQFASKYLYRK